MISVLDRLNKTLSEFSDKHKLCGVSYGMQEHEDLPRWNYLVFNRTRTAKSSNRIDRQTYYQVHLIHESYIPEGYIDELIEMLEAKDESGTKLKQTADDVTYDYILKPKTNLVVEIATITFVHPEKRVM